ncbi:HutD [compost metagenome]
MLEGEGMRLLVDGQPTRPLLPFDAFAFRGESQVSCTLLGASIRDFNLIYAPERYQARLQWLDGTQRAFSSASTVLLFAVSAQVDVAVAGQGEHRLGRYDCLQLEGNHSLQTINIQGRCCLIELSPH